jgi:hypothetical protein
MTPRLRRTYADYTAQKQPHTVGSEQGLNGAQADEDSRGGERAQSGHA